MTAPLIEREAQLEALSEALTAALAGTGRLVVIEAPGGMGKSALLARLRDEAARRGVRVLAALGSELGREFPFGVVRELLEPAVAEAPLEGSARLAQGVFGGAGTPVRADRAALLHALWWLLAGLGEAAPLLLCVDDAQWCDEPSLELLRYLAPRLPEVPVLAVAASRPGAAATAVGADATLLRLPPLSPAGVAALIAAELGAAPDDAFAAACERAAGGNPFLTRELAGELRREGVIPDAASAERVGAVRPDAVARTVLVRLARESPAAASLARALAVLGDGAALHHAAHLAVLGAADAAQAADALIRADVLADARPLAFVHPIVRDSVYADMTTAERGFQHGRAARLLDADGAAAERVASHLLEAEPEGDAWAVERLLAAAAVARARGAPEVAARYLLRALTEPPGDRRAAVELELGRAEALAGAPGGGLEHLRTALAAAPAGRLHAELAVELAQACVPAGRFDEAVDVLEAAVAQLGDADRELALRLEGIIASAGRLHPSTFGRARARVERWERVDGATPAERVLLAELAFQRLLDAAPPEEVLGLLAGAGDLLAEQTADFHPVFDALFARVVCDDSAAARRACDATLDDARRRGTLAGIGVSLCHRSHLALRCGAVADAEADARAALETAQLGRHVRAAGAVAFLCDALVERGHAAEAAALLARHRLDGELPGDFLATLLLFARARVRLAAGQAEAAIADLRALSERETYVRNPDVVPWRSTLALALAPREPAEACALAVAELEAARAAGSGRAAGVALRALGVVERSVERLREAVAELERTPARLELARALVDLGTVTRLAGRAADARDPLRQGGELAQRCGATALAERAREELAATGVRRVSRLLLTGVEGLTPTELRVARLAADGLTNRAIAEALFVTPKTVEVHLGHAYRKLSITGRSELPHALADGTGGVA